MKAIRWRSGNAVRGYLKEHGYRVAQVTLDFEDYMWNGPYARCMDKKDEKSIAWLKDSYLKTAKEYLTLDQEMSRQIFGRNIKHVLLMHIGAFRRGDAAGPAGANEEGWLQVYFAGGSGIGSGLPQRSGRGAGGWRDTVDQFTIPRN